MGCRFKEPMSEHSMKRIERKCETDRSQWVRLGDMQYSFFSVLHGLLFLEVGSG